MTEGTGYSLSDVAALMQNKSDGLFGGNGTGFIVLILFLLLIGGNGFWGNGTAAASTQGALTRAEMQDGFNNNQVQNGISDLKEAIANQTYALNTSVRDGFSATTLGMTNGFNGVTSAINNLGYQNQQCCCELKTAIHSEGEATRALIEANLVQNLRDRLADRDRELTAAQLTIQNTTQTSAILNQLGRYVTNPPVYGCSGCSGY